MNIVTTVKHLRYVKNITKIEQNLADCQKKLQKYTIIAGARTQLRIQRTTKNNFEKSEPKSK